MKTVLMVSNDFWPDNPGGVANHIMLLSQALVTKGHHVRIVHFSYSAEQDWHESNGDVVIDHIALSDILAHKNNLWSKIKRYWVTMTLGANKLQTIVDEVVPDIVHWHDYFHTSLAMRRVRFSGRKVLTNHTSGYLEYYNKPGLRPLLRYLAKPCDAVIGPSQELADKSRITRKPCFFIPNGVNTNKFKPVEDVIACRRKHRLPLQSPLVVAPRRLDPKNGLETLIRAMPTVLAEFPDAYFVVAGGGSQSLWAQYEQLANQQGVNDRLLITGYLDYSVMPEIIAASDVAVFPSYMEAVSLAMLESMACSLPVVASRVGGISQVLDDDLGELVDPGRPEELTSAINKLLGDQSLRKDKGHRARLCVTEYYDWASIAEATYNKAYGEVFG